MLEEGAQLSTYSYFKAKADAFLRGFFRENCRQKKKKKKKTENPKKIPKYKTVSSPVQIIFMVSSDSSCHCHCCNGRSRMCCSDCILVLLALLFPPLPVWIKCGICSAESFINIALSILGFLPGVIHSFYIIAKYPIKYVVLDEESQTYRPVNSRRERVVRVERVERIQTPSQEQVLNNANYGSTSGAPPAYSELDQRVASSSSGPVVQAPAPTTNDGKNTR